MSIIEKNNIKFRYFISAFFQSMLLLDSLTYKKKTVPSVLLNKIYHELTMFNMQSNLHIVEMERYSISLVMVWIGWGGWTALGQDLSKSRCEMRKSIVRKWSNFQSHCSINKVWSHAIPITRIVYLFAHSPITSYDITNIWP